MAKQWKLVELLNWTSEYLEHKGIENSRLQAERLLAHVLKMTRVQLYLNFDQPLHPAELEQFKDLLKRRTAQEPLQYILGETEFFSLTFKVAPAVLVPRPETELLVEKAIQVCRELSGHLQQIKVLDVGTGCGCIAVCMAKNIENAYIVAVDVSPEALKVARQNAEFHAVSQSIHFESIDALHKWPAQLHNTFDIVVCNPPYVRTREYENLDAQIRLHEPRIALLAGTDGLFFYREFAKNLSYLVKANSHVFFELGYEMSEEVVAIFQATRFAKATIHRDLNQRDRILQLQYREKIDKERDGI